MSVAPEVTQLLIAWSDGDESALDDLAPLVQAELKRLARHYLKGERAGQRLETAELVNEAWLRLIDWRNVSWKNRAHFFSVAAQMMRRVLVDEAREQQAIKRGGGAIRISLTSAGRLAAGEEIDLIEVDRALEELARLDQRKSRIVELRFFGGLSIEEVAEVLRISPRTVMRDWSFAQTWLFNELSR